MINAQNEDAARLLWDLVLGASLGFGAWVLELLHGSV
jgi:hypothetical protein